MEQQAQQQLVVTSLDSQLQTSRSVDSQVQTCRTVYDPVLLTFVKWNIGFHRILEVTYKESELFF